MKFELTIKDAAEILAKVAKAEDKMNAYLEADSEYERISGIADDFFAKNGSYSMVTIDARCAARERRDKALRVAYKNIKDAAESMEPSSSDYRWEQICNNASHLYGCNIRESMCSLKSIMIEQMRFVAVWK